MINTSPYNLESENGKYVLEMLPESIIDKDTQDWYIDVLNDFESN